jgi:hypothetical protein
VVPFEMPARILFQSSPEQSGSNYFLLARAFLAHFAYCFPKPPAQRVPLQKLYYREE